MNTPHSHTLHEIQTQPAGWAAALAAVESRRSEILALFDSYAERPLIVSGCGSPYYLARSAAPLFRMIANVPFIDAPASELVFAPETFPHAAQQALLLICSRSGETSEAVAAARLIRRQGGAVIAVGCDAGTTLLREAELAIEIAAAREQSVVQTRAFAAMFVGVQAIAALLAAERRGNPQPAAELAGIPALGPALIERAQHAVAPGGVLSAAADPRIERIFVLGAGTRYGLACEAALKFKEMSLTPTEAFHALEFRHGPMSLVDDRTLVIGLIGSALAAEEYRVLHEMQQVGGQVLALCAAPPAETPVPTFVLGANPPQPMSDALFLPPLHWMAYARTLARGLNPDSPRNLVPFITIDSLHYSDEQQA